MYKGFCKCLMFTILLGCGCFTALATAEILPEEPIDIGITPQFTFDNYIIDNYWTIRYTGDSAEAVERVFHQPEKYFGNPVITGNVGLNSVHRDQAPSVFTRCPTLDVFRMWYQTYTSPTGEDRRVSAIAYAESCDGISWTLPDLGLYAWDGAPNNIVWKSADGQGPTSPFLLEIPMSARRDYRYLMLYRDRGPDHGISVIGSNDAVHWTLIQKISDLNSDTQNSIVYDSQLNKYVMYLRAVPLYRSPPKQSDLLTDEEKERYREARARARREGENLTIENFVGREEFHRRKERYIRDGGHKRRIARLESRTLWAGWGMTPQTILVPDEFDRPFNFFYGMPTKVYGDVYWGLLWLFKWNSDVHTELTISRDGLRFDRLPDRPKLIERGERGEEGSWDEGMVFGAPWVEVGDEWWIYYSGWDGPHNADVGVRNPGIGLVKLRKEGFISMRGPANGAVLATRKLRWPGGQLLVNADASGGGELKVRVTDEAGRPRTGFSFDDSITFHGDSVSYEIMWESASISSLAGEVIRLEFYIKNADLYTFRATGEPEVVIPPGGPGESVSFIPCLCIAPMLCSYQGPGDRIYSCGRPVPWYTPFELTHPVNRSQRLECLKAEEGCREALSFEWSADQTPLDLQFSAAARLSFQLLDRDGNIIGKSVLHTGAAQKRRSPRVGQFKQRLFVPELKRGVYHLVISGPPSTYYVRAVPPESP